MFVNKSALGTGYVGAGLAVTLCGGFEGVRRAMIFKVILVTLG